MSPASLAGTVHESKAQRQERLKSRFRDRGGIFVPSEGNALADVLLARGINGESPLKKRTPRKKSMLTPKTRPPSSTAAASRVTGSKTPRTGAPKRASRKLAAPPSDADENRPPLAQKRRKTSKRAKLPEGRRTPGPSRPRDTAQRVPFANQLADAINSAKTQTVTDSSSTSEKVNPVTAVPSLIGKSERALGKRSVQAAAALLPRYSAEYEPPDLASVYSVKKIKSPLFLALERQQQDAQRTAGGMAAAAAKEPVESHALPELEGCESGDSDVPLAIKSTKRTPAAKPHNGKGSAPEPPTKRRSKAKALGLGVDRPDDAAIRAKTTGPPKAKKGSTAEEWDAEPDTVAVAAGRRKVAPSVDADLPPPPPPPTTHAGANSSGRKKVQVLQEKSTPANAPRKRKERMKTLLDPSAKDEYEHEPPRKKSRRADHTSRSRGKKENKEMSRSAREAAKMRVDKPLPSPVKQPGARPKPASKAKPASSRAGATQAPRSRGLPLDILRRIKANAQALPGPNDIDDDDPIDFLRL